MTGDEDDVRATEDSPGETPLRRLEAVIDHGCRVLNADAPGARYLDGSEAALLHLLKSSSDLSVMSDELRLKATSWLQEYHLSPSRANVLRAFALGDEARVLEVGAGCGPVTRFLGETCAVVDALEPSAARAAVARERTRDLHNVEVFVGTTDELPPEQAYDVVIAVGVLGQCAGGDRADEPYVAFLQRLADVLVPGGHLVLAIANTLGVKYLAGAPEDHTWRVCESIEDYPRPEATGVRTFSRAHLEDLVVRAGLRPRTFGAFPDHKLPRVVFAHPLPPQVRSLEWRIPDFPSLDRGVTRSLLTDERRLWRSLVEAGLAADTANSLILVAGKDVEPGLLPAGRLGVFWSSGRRAHFSTETVLRQDGDDVLFERRLLRPEPADDGARTWIRVLEAAPFVDGTELPELLLALDPVEMQPWLHRWTALVADAVRLGDAAATGILPHDIVVDLAGELRVIGGEWRVDGWGRDEVLARGVLWLGVRLAARAHPGRWHGCAVTSDVVAVLGRIVELPDGWISAAVAREAELQVAIAVGPEGSEHAALDVARQSLVSLLESPLEELSQGVRVFERVPALQAALRAVEAERDEHSEAVDALREEVLAAHGELVDVRRHMVQARVHAQNVTGELAAARSELVDVQRALAEEQSTVEGLAERLARSTALLRREETSLARPLARRIYRTARRAGSSLSPESQARIRAALAPLAVRVGPVRLRAKPLEAAPSQDALPRQNR